MVQWLISPVLKGAILALGVALSVWVSPPAYADTETWSYVGNAFPTTANRQAGSVLATITLNCGSTPCDGTYTYLTSPFNTFSLSGYLAGTAYAPGGTPLTLDSSSADVTYLGSNVFVLANGVVTNWILELQKTTLAGSIPQGSLIGTCGNATATPLNNGCGGSPSQFYVDQVAIGNGGGSNNIVGNSATAAVGSWSCTTPNGAACVFSTDAAPGPIPGAGLLSYLALGLFGLGSYGWKRLRARGLAA
jgi:hypothetical protein